MWGYMKLIRYEAARYALSEVVAVDEVKDIRDKAVAMAEYARQANDTELLEHATEIRVRAERRAGELLRDMEKNTGQRGQFTGGDVELPPAPPPTLAELGIGKHQSSRWQKLAAVPEEQFEAAVAAAKEIVGEVTAQAIISTHNHRAQGTGENEWYTPVEYINAAKEVMGGIDLDPASSATAQLVVDADRFFTIDDDGLQKRWGGRVWLNPPYSQPAIQDFMEKFANEVHAGHIDEGIVLTHNYTDTKWFQLAAGFAEAICFTKGRIGFLSPDGKRAAPTQGQVFFYVGGNVGAFIAVFKRFGFIMVRP